MTKNDFPEEVFEFIRDGIDSVEQLHILLLLLQRQDEEWTVASLSQELRSSAGSVEMRVGGLLSQKILAPESITADRRIHYVPASPEIAKTVQRLADFYRLCPHKVVAGIFAKSPTAIRSFSDAFLFRKKKEDS